MMYVDEVEQRFEEYELAYLDELRRQMSLSPEVPDALPYFLKGANEITTVLGRDGAVVINRDAHNDSFKFSRSDKTINEILQEQGVGIEIEKPGGEPPDSVRIAGPTWTMEWGEERPASEDFGWGNVEIISTSGVDGRMEEAARTQARLDVQTFVSARLMGLKRGNPEETRDRVIAELEAAINNFEQLLDSDPNEPKLQMFLELPRNKVLLDPSAKSVTPEVWLGNQYRIIDFVLELPQQRHVLVEIERPRDELYTTRDGDPAHRHKHGQQQIMNWIEWLDENKDFARKNIPALGTVKEPEYRLVLGLRSNTSEEYQKKLTRKNAEHHRIETMTFDDLLDRAKQYLENLRQL